MRAASVSITARPKARTLPCPDCGVTQEVWQASFPRGACLTCGWHQTHSADFSPLCPICVAEKWKTRFRAARIFFFRLLHGGSR